MKAASAPDFKQHYATHLKRLQLQGPRPKTIEAYAWAIRHLGAYFDGHIDDLTEAQLTDYFSDLLSRVLVTRGYGVTTNQDCPT